MKILKIRKARKLVNKECIQTTKDFRKDSYRFNFSEKFIKNAFIKGIHLEAKELYPNPERYKSKFYVLHSELKTILIGYDVYKDHVTLIHCSPLGEWESTQYKKEKKLIKRRGFIGLFL